MKKSTKILIAGILVGALFIMAMFSSQFANRSGLTNVSAQSNVADGSKKSEKIVIQNFVVKTLQAIPVVQIAATATPAPVPDVNIVYPSPVQNEPQTANPAVPYSGWTGRAVEIVPTDANVRAPAYACNVTMNSPYYFQQYNPGEDFDLDVTFTNTGTEKWDTDIDVMQYTGMRLEIEGKYLYDIDKDYDSAVIVYPGQSIRWKIRMEAPKERYHDDNKYFATYNLIRGRSAALASGQRNEDEDGMFCPFTFYIYVP